MDEIMPRNGTEKRLMGVVLGHGGLEARKRPLIAPNLDEQL
jgi:hypothetical protein